ncbi:MAG: transporter substrate-binding domain-containing protein [Oscillospiraceae bacterium]|nr:transporter substrate-binding domain-containing protein [Oscillospiraceae bacterium]
MKNKYYKLLSVMLALSFLLILNGCAGNRNGDTPEQYYKNEDFIGKSMSVLHGSAFIELFSENFGGFIPVYADSNLEKLELVNCGLADAGMLDEPIARKLLTRYDNMTIVYPGFADDNYGFAFSKNNSALCELFNAFLTEIKSNGVYEDLIERWFDTEISPPMPDIPLTGAEGKLIFATTGVSEAVSYMDGRKLAGFDIEIAVRFAQYADMSIEFITMDFGELLPAVANGSADFAGNLLTITEARKEIVSFSDPYYEGGSVLVAKIPDAPQNAPKIFIPDYFTGKKIAAVSETIFGELAEEYIQNAEIVYFSHTNDAAEALKNGLVDAIVSDDISLKFYNKHNQQELLILEPYMITNDYAAAVSKENTALLNNLNDFIKLIESEGTYYDMLSNWLESASPVPAFESSKTFETTLKFGTSGVSDGFSYYENGKITGFDIDFAARFAEYMNMNLEIVIMEFHELLPAVAEGELDFAANLFTVTEEREAIINFSTPYYSGGAAVAVLEKSS